MNGNMKQMIEMMQAWNVFKANHPKFPKFMKAVEKAGIREGTVLEIRMSSPDGQVIETSVLVKESDLPLFDMMRGLH